MNRALWRRAWRENRLHLAISCLLVLLFGWFFLWLMSRFTIGSWSRILQLLPGFVQPMLAVPLDLLASPAGQISVLYVHVIVMLVAFSWAIGQGSDCVSGQVGRGTLEHLLALPIQRTTVIVVGMGISTLGCLAICAAVWLGTCLGLLTTRVGAGLTPWMFLPGALNLFAMMFCMAGVTSLISACGRDRWGTIKIAGGLLVVEMIIKFIARMWPEGQWLRYATFLSAFEPQRLILVDDQRGRLLLEYNGLLLGLGLAGYVAAAIVISRRDIPV